MIKSQFTLYLENRPGVLAAVAGKLAKAKVNIEGISAATSSDVGIVQLIVSSAAAASKVLDKAKIAYTTQKVAVLPLKNKPGELARLAGRLGRQGVNLNYLYGTACESGAESMLVVSAEDLKKLERAWK